MLDPVRRFFLLDRTGRAPDALSGERGARVRALARAADARHRAARALSDEDQLVAAAALDTEATKLAMAALLLSHGREASPLDAAALGTGIQALIDAGEISPVPELAKVRLYLGDDGLLAFDGLALERAIPRRGRMGRVAGALLERLEPYTLTSVRRARARRIGVLAVLAVLAVGWGFARFAFPRNLADAKPVTASSRAPFQPAAAGPEGLAPAGLTDGDTSRASGICTRDEVGPWAQVDLGRPEKIGRIVVYGQGDAAAQPVLLVLEVSLDGATYVEVGRRAEPLSKGRPWTVGAAGAKARFVRARVDGPEPHVLSLSELEVYAR
jgi:hypothetical protein